MLCRVVIENIDSEETLAQFKIEESATGFKSPAFQPHGIKQSSGSSGEGIWITTRFGGHTHVLHQFDVLISRR